MSRIISAGLEIAIVIFICFRQSASLPNKHASFFPICKTPMKSGKSNRPNKPSVVLMISSPVQSQPQRRSSRTITPGELDFDDMRRYLTHLAVERNVAAATQNQALNAILFLYRHVLDIDTGEEINAVRAEKRRRLPVVLSKGEVDKVFSGMQGTMRLMAMLTYGCGLRLSECLNLRIKDLDLERDMLIVRSPLDR